MKNGLIALLIILFATFGAGTVDMVFDDVVPLRPYTQPFIASIRQFSIDNLISAPLYPVLALIVVVVVISIAIGIAVIGASASTGLVSFRTTLSSFMPLFGVGLSTGLVVAFLSVVIKKRMDSGAS